MGSNKQRIRRSREEVAQAYGMKVRDIRPGETEEQYFKALAKQADQRLVRLEHNATQKGYYGMLDYAYNSAMYDIKRLSGDENAHRFNLVLKKNKAGEVDKRLLHSRINAVKRFLESPTSSIQGINRTYRERTKKLNENLGTNFTWQEMAKFFEKENAMKTMHDYGSEVVLKAFYTMKKTPKREDIEKVLKSSKNVSGDKIVDEVAWQLQEQGLTFDDMFK